MHLVILLLWSLAAALALVAAVADAPGWEPLLLASAIALGLEASRIERIP